MKLTVVEKGKKVIATVRDESFVCHPETLIKYHRYINQAIDQKTLEALKKDNEYYHTFSKALRKLSHKAYSVNALRKTLSDHPLIIVNQVIDELLKLNYVNDTELLKQYKDDFFYQDKSLKAYQFKLIEKGFLKKDIELTFKDVDFDETQKLSEIFNKKHHLFKNEPLQKQKDKLTRYGVSLGYAYDVIHQALTALELKSEHEHELLIKELKKYPPPSTFQDKEKLKAKLFRRGYKLSDIEKALKEDS